MDSQEYNINAKELNTLKKHGVHAVRPQQNNNARLN